MAVRTYTRLLRPPSGSFFLVGVRGVGKTTWTRAAFPDAHVVDLPDEVRYQTLLANPACSPPRSTPFRAAGSSSSMRSSASRRC